METKQIEINHYGKNKTQDFCLVCGKDFRAGTVKLYVHLVDGGSHIARPETPDEEIEYDQGWFRVGPDCAKKLGMDWVFKGG